MLGPWSGTIRIRARVLSREVRGWRRGVVPTNRSRIVTNRHQKQRTPTPELRGRGSLSPDGRSKAPAARAWFSLLLLGIDILLLALTIASVHGPVRFAAGVAFSCVVPGWTVVGHLRIKDLAAMAGLTIAVSWALLMVAAQVLITWHLWHLTGFVEVACSVVVVPLALQSRDVVRERGRR